MQPADTIELRNRSPNGEATGITKSSDMSRIHAVAKLVDIKHMAK
jgi:hypothetical protein